MRWFLVLALLLGTLPSSWAAESIAVSNAHARASLVTDTDRVQPGHSFRVALRLQLEAGWHTYWKNPGDAGSAPTLTLDLPQGSTASGIQWAMPERIAEGPVQTYAYTGDTLFPVTVTTSPGVIKAHADYLVCRDICIPESADFAVTLPLGEPRPSPEVPLFAQHDRAVPSPSPWTTHIAADGTLSVQGPELSPATVIAASFIPDEPDRISDDAEQRLSVYHGGLSLKLTPGPQFRSGPKLAGILSVQDRSRLVTNVSLETDFPTATAPGFPPLAEVLVFAFIGGLILNLMPCVFPVLVLKALALSSDPHRTSRLSQALSYTAGILATFIGLGVALLSLRRAGVTAGWGFQFTSPMFVAAIAWLLFAIGLNLSGVFEIGSGLGGLGNSLTRRQGYVGSFFTGLLAVLVATPCTAPFMGVAIAAGLAAPPSTTMLVFSFMALGLATPYLALASAPGSLRVIPRAGRWMETVKQGLAFPLYATVVWLVWVLSQESGSAGVLATGIGIVLIAFSAWVFGISQTASTGGRRFGHAATILSLLAAIAVLSDINEITASGRQDDGGGRAEAFSSEILNSLRAQGRPVFVNMTASWCVTCLVNEQMAISTTAVQNALAAGNIAYLKGDWTRQPPEITSFLQKNGRDGVPLYIFYPSDHQPPKVLPQLLTEKMLLRALKTS